MTNSTNNVNVAIHTLAAAVAKGADLHFYLKFQGIRSANFTTGIVEELNNEVHETSNVGYYTMVSATPGVAYWDIETVDRNGDTISREVQDGSGEGELVELKKGWAIWPVFFEHFRAAMSFPVQAPDIFGRVDADYCITPSELHIDRVKLARLIDWDLVKEEAPAVADYSYRIIRSTKKVGGTFADLF